MKFLAIQRRDNRNKIAKRLKLSFWHFKNVLSDLLKIEINTNKVFFSFKNKIPEIILRKN